MLLPSGDQRGDSSRTSGVLVRLTSSPPAAGTAKTSQSSFPPVSCWKTSHLPSGDQVSPYCRSSDCESWMGQPPPKATCHRLGRPELSVVKAMVLPSGDQEAPRMEWVK